MWGSSVWPPSEGPSNVLDSANAPLAPRPPPRDRPEDALAVIHDFVSRCRQWANDIEIPKRLRTLEDVPEEAQIASLQRWVTYLAMTEHTLRELEDGTLDHWFQEHGPSSSSDS